MVSDRIAERVSGAVSAPHDHGCAQLGADNDQTERTLIGVGANPNIAGTVVVGLGCEEIQSTEVAAKLHELGVPVRELSIQDAGGTEACIVDGTDYVKELRETDRADATTAALGDLTVGIISSDARESTRNVAEPLVGDLTERVIEAGGRVLVGGVERFVPHADAVAEYTTGAAKTELGNVLSEHHDRPSKNMQVRREAADCPITELTRAHGSIPIEQVLAYGERATFDSGLGFVETPAQFEEAATGLAAAGAHLIIHVTADGIPTGHPIMPVLKVTGDADTATVLSEDIDVDARSTDSSDLVETVESLANGTPCHAEEHGLTEFALTRVGPSM